MGLASHVVHVELDTPSAQGLIPSVGMLLHDGFPSSNISARAILSRFQSITRYSPFSILQIGWTATQCTKPKHARIPPDVTEIPEPRTLGYTFDDGPNCTHNAFYNYLASQNQKATLFYIGSNVIDWPLEAQRGLVDGHQLCMRGYFLYRFYDSLKVV